MKKNETAHKKLEEAVDDDVKEAKLERNKILG